MKKILSIKYSAAAFNFSMFALRVVFGICLLVNHGYMKMINFEQMQSHFYNFLGMGSKISLILVIFAEVLCSLFVILGLFTRLAVIPLIINMLVAVLGVHASGSFDKMEPALLYFTAFIIILLCGPGRLSIDAMINK